jgi:hypothetical protein
LIQAKLSPQIRFQDKFKTALALEQKRILDKMDYKIIAEAKIICISKIVNIKVQ